MRLLTRRRPPRYTPEQRARLARQYDGLARHDDKVARQLEDLGRADEAAIHRRTAAEWRDRAEAARTSSRALELLT
ncbi:hypothetical protein [Streptomyces violaceorubidus]|uniref:hypothetical protein n=1 Tax=Streptomyces violaceorubidus TaxID=284042 RepID=UPI0004C0AF3E|nr:hypothetical protein [Streptomyces violaceorubidus]